MWVTVKTKTTMWTIFKSNMITLSIYLFSLISSPANFWHILLTFSEKIIWLFNIIVVENMLKQFSCTVCLSLTGYYKSYLGSGWAFSDWLEHLAWVLNAFLHSYAFNGTTTITLEVCLCADIWTKWFLEGEDCIIKGEVCYFCITRSINDCFQTSFLKTPLSFIGWWTDSSAPKLTWLSETALRFWSDRDSQSNQQNNVW